MNVIHIFIKMSYLALLKDLFGSSCWDLTHKIISAFRATSPLRNIQLLNPLLPSSLWPSSHSVPHVTSDSTIGFSSRGFRSVRVRLFIASKHTADDLTYTSDERRIAEISCLVEMKTHMHKVNTGSCEEAICVLCWIWGILNGQYSFRALNEADFCLK